MILKDCQAFIFEMDGVVVDSEGLYKTIEKEIFEEVGVVINNNDEHITYQGCSNLAMWGLVKEKHGIEKLQGQFYKKSGNPLNTK